MRYGQRTHADFSALGLDQRGNLRSRRIGIRIVCRNRFDRLRRAASVVRVEAKSALCIELGVGPRAEDQTCLRAGQELTCRARIGSVHRRRVSQTGDDKFIVVAAQSQDGAEFVRPLDLVFGVRTDHRVRKAIPLTGRGQGVARAGICFVHAHASFRRVETVVDPVVAELEADGIRHLAPIPLAKDGVVRVEPGHPAPFLLLKLVTASGINQVVSEVRKQIEIVIEAVGHQF